MAHYQGYKFFEEVEIETFIILFSYGTINPPPASNYNRESYVHYQGYNAFDPSYGNRIIGFRTRYDNNG